MEKNKIIDSLVIFDKELKNFQVQIVSQNGKETIKEIKQPEFVVDNDYKLLKFLFNAELDSRQINSEDRDEFGGTREVIDFLKAENFISMTTKDNKIEVNFVDLKNSKVNAHSFEGNDRASCILNALLNFGHELRNKKAKELEDETIFE